MLKKQISVGSYFRGNSSVAPYALVSLALLISSAAVQAQSMSAASAPPALASKPVTSVAEPQALRAQAFQTAPFMPSAPASGAAAAPRSAEGVAALNALAKATVDNSDAPWTLEAELHPWPINYAQPGPLNTLLLTLPDLRDARFQLPGATADSADRARLTVNRYITDNIGMAAQTRGRQFETFTLWAENSRKQKSALPKDPWAVYQFHREANAALGGFKAKVLEQTEPSLTQMANEVRTAVDGVSVVMNAAGSYEQKMQWYNVLVQLRDGIALYQARVADSDRQILDAIGAYELENPPVARPDGPPPQRKTQEAQFRVPDVTGAPPNAALTPDGVKREKAQPPAAKEEQSQVGGVLVVLGVAAVILGFFFIKIRRRVSGAGGRANNES